jgi:hypothetical protein
VSGEASGTRLHDQDQQGSILLSPTVMHMQMQMHVHVHVHVHDSRRDLPTLAFKETTGSVSRKSPTNRELNTTQFTNLTKPRNRQRTHLI